LFHNKLTYYSSYTAIYKRKFLNCNILKLHAEVVIMNNNSTVTNSDSQYYFLYSYFPSALRFIFYEYVVKYFKYESYFSSFSVFFLYICAELFFSLIWVFNIFLKAIIVYDISSVHSFSFARWCVLTSKQSKHNVEV